MPPDTIAEAVLAREDVARFLEGSHGLSSAAARTKVMAYLDELQTTQRYELYRALEYPLYPILRKIERVGENQQLAVDAVKKGRVVYASNHRSHIDYLVEPLVLDDAGIRPPIIAAGIKGLTLVPVAVSYDLVLEDHVIARQKVKRSQKAFSREIAELVRYAVGYWSRAVVTFGKPIAIDGIDPENKKAVIDLTRHVRREIGKQYKVLPTAVLAAAMKRSATRAEMKGCIDGVLDTLRSVNANLSVKTADEVLEQATEPLATRNIIVVEQGRYRVRERNVLRYYARSLAHLLSPPSSTH